MDKNKFVKQFATEKPIVDNEWALRVINDGINANSKDTNPRGHRNLIIVMEELAELQQAISKELRDKGDSVNLLEELADVQICIHFVQDICNISDEDLNKAMNIKLKRLEKVLHETGEFK